MANVSTLFDKDWTSAWEEQQAWLKRKKEHDASESKKAKEVCSGVPLVYFCVLIAALLQPCHVSIAAAL